MSDEVDKVRVSSDLKMGRWSNNLRPWEADWDGWCEWRKAANGQTVTVRPGRAGRGQRGQ
jgi:hypothetical protein